MVVLTVFIVGKDGPPDGGGEPDDAGERGGRILPDQPLGGLECDGAGVVRGILEDEDVGVGARVVAAVAVDGVERRQATERAGHPTAVVRRGNAGARRSVVLDEPDQVVGVGGVADGDGDLADTVAGRVVQLVPDVVITLEAGRRVVEEGAVRAEGDVAALLAGAGAADVGGVGAAVRPEGGERAAVRGVVGGHGQGRRRVVGIPADIPER
jgi:hypothetical protein